MSQKMDEFPDNYDDFESLYADELDMMREMEMESLGIPKGQQTSATHEPSSIQDNGEPTQAISSESVPNSIAENASKPKTDGASNNLSYDEVMKRADAALAGSKDLGLRAKRLLPFSEKSNEVESQITSKRKRKKMSSVPLIDAPHVTKSQSIEDQADELLIEQIVQYRKMQSETTFSAYVPGKVFGDGNKSQRSDARIHRRLPKGEFLSLTTCSGHRYYLDLIDQDEFSNQIKAVSQQKDDLALLPESYHSIKRKAEIELEKLVTRRSLEEMNDESHTMTSNDSGPNDLWVERYKPRGYLDLLSDESTNRAVLNWIKLWDKLVFGLEWKKVKKKEKSTNFKDFKPKFINKFAPEVIYELDEQGKPIQKVILLCGPPGLGKTTLAHIIARHAGYSIVEMNASDDRSTEVFKKNLENATLMKTVFGNDKHPNCLIIDEIDGAPAPSIELLVRMLTEGGNSGKTSQPQDGKKKKKEIVVLKRPVICICNDLYTPSLRSLRQIALIIQFPPIFTVRLTDRLKEICLKQRLHADLSLLRALCEKTENDVRSCLSALQFVKSTSGELRITDLEGVAIGQKDYQRSLFSAWNEIFTIPRPSRKPVVNPHKTKESNVASTEEESHEGKGKKFSFRFHRVLQVVQSCGEYDKLALGWFENYPEAKVKNATLDSVVGGLEWAIFTDVIQKEIHHSQSWILLGYVCYAFVAFHMLFASHQKPKLHFPKQYGDHLGQLNKNQSIMSTLQSEMCPLVLLFCRGNSLLYDFLPYLLQIIQPSLRSVNVKLFNSKEKDVLNSVVSTMISYNLTYQQDRSAEGQYTFTLEPNVEDMIHFTGITKGKPLSYSSRQLVSREIELEKVRKAEKYFASQNKEDSRERPVEQPVSKPPLPQMPPQKPQPKTIVSQEKQVVKDFFGRVISVVNCQDEQSESHKGRDLWFKFKVGYSNAVRRPIKVKEFLL